MTLTDALARLRPARGFTSVVAGVLSGDLDPITGAPLATVEQGLVHALEQVDRFEAAQARAQSDWAYWGYYGDVCYWRTVAALFRAAMLVGPAALPDVPGPRLGTVVMDVGAFQEQWGQQVLAAARRQVNATVE